MTAVTTRYATLEDLPAILPLFEAYRAFYGEAPRPDDAMAFLEERYFLGESKVIVAEWQGRIIGFTQLFPSFSSVTLQRLWILNDLYVDESGRRQGAGRALLEAAAAMGRRTNAKQLFIEGAVANTRARGLYEDFGFIRNEEYYYYHLPLTPSVKP